MGVGATGLGQTLQAHRATLERVAAVVIILVGVVFVIVMGVLIWTGGLATLNAQRVMSDLGPCYHAREAQRVRTDGDHTVTQVDRQMGLLREIRGTGQHAQLIGGEVSMYPGT